MRSCILEALRNKPRTQYLSLKSATASVAQRLGYEVQEQMSGEPTLQRADERRFREAIWSLIIEGVMVIGQDASNADWPWSSLSEYGEETIKAGRPIPNDTE